MTSTLVQSPAWRRLQNHAQALRPQRIDGLFERDPDRAAEFSASSAGFHLDYSKQLIDRDGLTFLLALAQQQRLPEWIARLAAGEAINSTEGRAAAHMALRAPAGSRMNVQGADVVPMVQQVLARMGGFAARLRNGEWRGFDGQTITDVVNIGIGGSDFGPRMVCEALREQADGPRMHFVSNVDGAEIGGLLPRLDPARTLWIVTSKTFTTQETMTNARTARSWLLQHAGQEAIARHFVAVSTNRAEIERFGIDAANMFEFWDWVGGRYSLWSAVGLPIMVSLGAERFGELLAGARAMDEHFISSPLDRNLPVLMALLAVWNFNFLDHGTQVMAAYAQRLEKFIGWLQQLELESNGKGVNRDGEEMACRTATVLWGDVGSNSQHAFFQMLHQGPRVHPVDFILPLQAMPGLEEHQNLMIANCLAQSAALMKGKTAQRVREELSAKGMQGEALEEAIPHRVFAGNRPSNTLLLPRLDAWHLGALLALYEHRTFVESVIWEINAFDQWGVELGKQLAQDVLKAMDGQDQGLDPSTLALLEKIRLNRA
ncbi:glucose-6-phosphate isomerase [Solimonas sp. K1W22B-7]|uniref:glucose-6-phosphate isomerase n=1 Tax=Solimonas sp. K1W22B-7 TaxID=2303331 RepID=UPI000E32D479|nr:glucose-6-phosphate isomerase [Solimonas sp. K1W22B-7]AXQ29690.1 glucose-6-phosphate isomerase [Solimonas sp. K1W22B-7]